MLLVRGRARLGGEDASVVVDVARLDEDALGELGNLEIEARHDAVESLDEGHGGAEGGVHIGELEADVPSQPKKWDESDNGDGIRSGTLCI